MSFDRGSYDHAGTAKEFGPTAAGWGEALASPHDGLASHPPPPKGEGERLTNWQRLVTDRDTSSGLAARTTLQTLMDDPAWGKRLLEGDSVALSDFRKLSAAQAGANQVTEMAGGAPVDTPLFETTFGNQLSTRNLAIAIEDMRQGGLDSDVILEAFENRPVTRGDYLAVQRLRSQLFSDGEWVKRYMANGFEERRQMRLIAIVMNAPIKND